ncbi:hypothetical protein EON70_00200 [bacterium]|nr:MAG: hypothetical protein EON70_00200 [bacterium]
MKFLFLCFGLKLRFSSTVDQNEVLVVPYVQQSCAKTLLCKNFVVQKRSFCNATQRNATQRNATQRRRVTYICFK